MARTFRFRTRDGRSGIVREAHSADANACLRIVEETARERPRTLAVLADELWNAREWRRNRIPWSDRGVTLVAEVDGEVVGHLSATRGLRAATRHTAEFGITVAAASRGIRVGRALLDAFEAWARDVGVTRLTLGVFAHNERAQSLYRAVGYVEEGVEHGGMRFPEGELDLIRMYKRIDKGTRAVHETVGTEVESDG